MLAVLTLVLLFVAWLGWRWLLVGWAEQQQVWGELSDVSVVLAYIDERRNHLLAPPCTWNWVSVKSSVGKKERDRVCNYYGSG